MSNSTGSVMNAKAVVTANRPMPSPSTHGEPPTGQQHNADHQHNAHQIGGELDDGNQRGPQAQPVVSLGMLYGMPYFMGGDGSGGNAVGIVNGLASG